VMRLTKTSIAGAGSGPVGHTSLPYSSRFEQPSNWNVLPVEVA